VLTVALGNKLGLITSAGRDATEAFEDVGHSDEARGYLPPMLIGDFEKDGVRFLIFSPSAVSPDANDVTQVLKFKSGKSSGGSNPSVNDAVEKGSKYVSSPHTAHSPKPDHFLLVSCTSFPSA